MGRTPAGVPTLRRAEPGSSRLASTSRSGINSVRPGIDDGRTSPSASTQTAITRPRTSFRESGSGSSQYRTHSEASAGSSTRSTFSERSTLVSFRGSSSGSVRGDSTTAHEPLPSRKSSSHSHFPYYPTGYFHNYYSGSYYGSHHSGYYGWHYNSYYGSHHYSPGIYFGSFALAVLSGNAWYIQPYYGQHWFLGFRYGGHCDYYAFGRYRDHHTYYYRGRHCRVHRPLWYGYATWYDYNPIGYGYTRYVYTDIYVKDGDYEDGYVEGYEDGAEDLADLIDERRRDRIGPRLPAAPRVEFDRAHASASSEFRRQTTIGETAFLKGDFEAATSAFKEAVILNPTSARAKMNLAVGAMAAGKYTFAAFALKRAAALEPEAVVGVGALDLYVDNLVRDQHLERLEKQLAANPGDSDLLLLAGFMRYHTGMNKGAAEALDEALQLVPEDPAATRLYKAALEALEGE